MIRAYARTMVKSADYWVAVLIKFSGFTKVLVLPLLSLKNYHGQTPDAYRGAHEIKQRKPEEPQKEHAPPAGSPCSISTTKIKSMRHQILRLASCMKMK